jgi:hypothetical protein
VYGQSIEAFRLLIVNNSKEPNHNPKWTELPSSEWVTLNTDENGHVVGFTSIKSGYYFRLVLAGDPETAIVTVNEEIPD